MSPANMFMETDIRSMELSCRWCRVSYPSRRHRLELSPAPASSAKLTSVKPNFWKLRPPFNSCTNTYTWQTIYYYAYIYYNTNIRHLNPEFSPPTTTTTIKATNTRRRIKKHFISFSKKKKNALYERISGGCTGPVYPWTR